MLYNTLKAFMPYAIACGIIGTLMMIIRILSFNRLLNTRFSLNIIGSFLLTFIIGFYSLLPILISSSDILLTIILIFISTVILIFIFIELLDFDEDLFIFCTVIVIVHIIFSILFSCLLYSDYKVTEIKSDEIKLNNSTREICIVNGIKLNNIPENINDDKINETVNSFDTIEYWYLTKNNEALYNSVSVADSVLVPEESNHYYLEKQKYVTISKIFTKHKVISITPTIRYIYVFHIPKELIGIN